MKNVNECGKMLYNFLSWDDLLCCYLDSERKKLLIITIALLMCGILFRGPHIFRKFRNYLKITGAWKVTWSNFHDADVQILGTTIQNFNHPADLMHGVCAPLTWLVTMCFDHSQLFSLNMWREFLILVLVSTCWNSRGQKLPCMACNSLNVFQVDFNWKVVETAV